MLFLRCELAYDDAPSVNDLYDSATLGCRNIDSDGCSFNCQSHRASTGHDASRRDACRAGSPGKGHHGSGCDSSAGHSSAGYGTTGHRTSGHSSSGNGASDNHDESSGWWRRVLDGRAARLRSRSHRSPSDVDHALLAADTSNASRAMRRRSRPHDPDADSAVAVVSRRRATQPRDRSDLRIQRLRSLRQMEADDVH
jgi:hypothetical protein